MQLTYDPRRDATAQRIDDPDGDTLLTAYCLSLTAY